MNTRKPPDVAILAARIQRAFPTLGPHQTACLAHDLTILGNAIHRHMKRSANGSDGGYTKLRRRMPHVVGPDGPILESEDIGAPRGYVREDDPETQQRTDAKLDRRTDAWLAKLGELVLISQGKDTHGWEPRQLMRACAGTKLETPCLYLEARFPGEPEGRAV